MRILSPKMDVIFKLLFGDARNADILGDFLQAVLDLDAAEFAELTIVDPHLKQEFPQDKLGILDVKLKTKSGHTIDIEIQVLSMPEMRQRLVYYLSNMITEQLREGDSYLELKRSICIAIVDFPLITESGSCHTVFRLLEQQEHFPFTNLLEINVLDLTKVPTEEPGKLMDWLRFIKAEQEEEFQMASNENAAIQKAYAKLQVLSDDEANKMLYDARVKAWRDEQSRLGGARRDGLAEGRAEGRMEGRMEGRTEGRTEGRAEIIRLMFADGTDAPTIAKTLHMEEARVAELLAPPM
ncbi:MAG: Rpn family recombination-promoting nuclease/putative transposase [Oscillospiraceae bacterium]|jgi:predicted transposase/invertase (TIGR01784 family)|nr:Rpn family recombination-promoting nuclease/putative transposase [Oscillospiraceae bacterium]